MAVPQEKTLQNLSGKWKLNKSLSDDYTQVLALQGVNMLVRKAIGAASISNQVEIPSQDKIFVKQTATAASIPGTTEEYILDWQWRSNHDAFFGEVQGRSRWIHVSEAETTGIHGQWLVDSDSKLINAEGRKTDGSWSAMHLWGFEEVGGVRRHTRRVKISNKEGQELIVRMVYDFLEN